MSTNKQALLKKLNRRLNDAFGFQRTSGGKHTTISLSISECKSVIVALGELDKWQQESSTWKSVAEKQLAIAIEAEKRIAELTAPDGNAIAWESTTPVYIKFITDERYQKLRPGYQKWYKPYCCSNCAAGISVKGE